MADTGSASTGARSRLVAAGSTVFATKRRLYLAVFGIFLALTLIWFAPLVVHLDSTVLMGPADSTLSIRSYWAISHQHGDPFTLSRDMLNGAPEGLPWYRAVVIAQPFQTVAVFALHPVLGFIGAFNVFLLTGIVLTGFFAFVLLDRLGFHPLVSLVGGYILAFNPWCFMRAFAGHAAFLHVWIFIAMILCLLEMSRTRAARWAALAGLCYGGSFLFSSYFGLLGTLVFSLYLVFEFLRVRGWEEKLWSMTLACVGLTVTLACILPGIIAYGIDHASIVQTISNPIGELQQRGAAAGSYLLPARNHPVFGPITRHFTSSANFAEQTLFFGYTTMILAAVGVVLVIRRHPETTLTPTRRWALVFSSVLLPLAFWSSLRRVVHPFGIPVPTLSFFLGHVTTFFRVYARFGVIVGVALVILMAPALDLIVRRHRRGIAIGLALWAVVAFELLPGRVSAWAATSPPAYDQWLAHQPHGTVAHYPLPTDQEPAIHLGEREIYYQMFHGHPLYNLFGAGTFRTRENDIRILSRYVTDPLTPGILAAEHVRYVFVHDDVYREENEPLPTLSPTDFRFVKRFPGVRVYVLRRTVTPVNLDQVLEQNAVEIALVEGLHVPVLGYTGFSTPTSKGLRTFGDGATLRIGNGDQFLKRLQIVINATSMGESRTLQLVDSSGNVVGQATIPTQNTQVTFGPFALGQGSSTYTLRVSPSGRDAMQLRPPLLQPVADFSVSLLSER